MLQLVWKLIKVWGLKLIDLALRLLKSQLKALVWKYGIMLLLIVFTALLAFFVLR